MKRNLILSIFLLITCYSFSQIPGIKWQRELGERKYDSPAFTVKTNDGGILLIGYLTDPSGNNSAYGPEDIWVEKLNDKGISEWKKLLGGTGSEYPNAYCYNADGSILILGGTASMDGDVTGNHGHSDIWIVKLDKDGNLLWQKTYGGSSYEDPSSIIRVSGGGYIFSAKTESNDGDITINHGGDDAWVVKIDETGNIVWQKTFGGSLNDGSDGDNKISDLVEDVDGSILFCTEVRSSDGDVVGNHGLSDIFLIRLSSAGNVIWKNCYGGNSHEYGASIKIAASGDIYVFGTTASTDLPSSHNSISNDKEDFYFLRISSSGTLLFHKCFGGTGYDASRALISIISDGSCLIGGDSDSRDGDVSGYHGITTNSDIWVLKIDLIGNIIWQRTLGGSSNESFLNEYDDGQSGIGIAAGTFIPTNDGGTLISCLTLSNDGDITGFHPISPINTSGGDIWVVKLSANGQLEWQRALGGARGDIPRPPLEFGTNDYILLGASCSRDGDLQDNQGAWDAWIIRFGAVNRIKGTVFVDQNGNGIKEPEDSLLSDATISAIKGTDTRRVFPYHGSFIIDVDTGGYNTTLTPLYPYYTVMPTSHSSSFSSYFNTDSFSFALHPLPGIKDLVISAIPISIARPGFPLKYILYYKNVGVVSVADVEVKFKKDSRLIIQTAQPAPNTIVGDTLKWNFSGLDPQKEGVILLNMTVAPPPATNNQDTLSSLAIIGPVLGDMTPLDDTAKINQRVFGAVDPNNKAESLGGSITKERVVAGDYITYFIRFQNTGTDTAFNVVVRDTLDNKLDWNSFQMISSSHPYTLQIDDQNKLIWTFYGINLPDSNINEPGSHGYIAYRIKADNTLNIGATFLNRASIYFDFNLPVHTNYAQMMVGTPIALPLKLLDFDANYQQSYAELNWTTVDESNVDKFIIERGVDPFHYVAIGTVGAKGGNIGGKTHYQFRDGLVNVPGNKFYYRLKMMDQDNKFQYSGIELVTRDDRHWDEVIIMPNPVRGQLGYACINFEREAMAELRIVDMQGRVKVMSQQRINKGVTIIPLITGALSDGSYIFQVKAAGTVLTSKFVFSR